MGPARDILDSVNPFWTFTRWMDMTEQARSACGANRSRSTKPTDVVARWKWVGTVRPCHRPHPQERIHQPLFTYDPGDGAKSDSSATKRCGCDTRTSTTSGLELSPARRSTAGRDTSSAAMKSNQNIFANGPPVLASSCRPALPTSPRNKERRFEVTGAQVQGVDNAHRVAVMKFPIDIKRLVARRKTLSSSP